MIAIPAAFQEKWDSAVKNLEPFQVRLYIYSAETSTTKIFYKDSIIDMLVTKTLYDKASIGGCASSQIDLSLYPKENGVFLSSYSLSVGDKISVFITPQSIYESDNRWWAEHGVFYITDVEVDAYTNISRIKGADALTFFGDRTFLRVAQGALVGFGSYYGGSPDIDFEQRCAQTLSVSLSHPAPMGQCREWQWGVYVNGYPVRNVLSMFGIIQALNYTIDNTGALKPIPFNHKTTPVSLGRRAEKIERNGSWTDYLFTLDLSRQIEEIDSSQGAGAYIRTDNASCEAKTNGSSTPIHFSGTAFNVGNAGYNTYADTLASIYNSEQYVYRKYNAFTCTNIVFDPALELGDQVTVLNKSDSPLLAHDNNDPLLWIEPGNDDTKIAIDQPHAYIPYWEQQQTEDGVTGPIGKLVVDYKTPQIAQLLQSPAPQG